MVEPRGRRSSSNRAAEAYDPAQSARMVDDVDRIAAAWQALHPGLDATPLQVFSRISRIARLQESLRRSVFAEQGLDGWEFDVLSALRRSGEPFELTPRDLIQETFVTSGTMTTRLHKLEVRHLVRRRRAEGDGRSVLVRLSEEGIRLADAAILALVEAEQKLLNSLTEEQTADMGDGLRCLLRSFAQFDADPR